VIDLVAVFVLFHTLLCFCVLPFLSVNKDLYLYINILTVRSSTMLANTMGEVTSWQPMVTTRSPFCGHTMAKCVEFRGEDLPFRSNGIKSVGKKMSLTYQRNVCK